MSAAVAEVYEHSEAPESVTARVQFGSIQVDCASYEVWANGAQVVLTARERGLLVYLSARLGRLITREELLSQVWGQRYDGGPRTVDIHVSRLRRKLGQELPLVTLRGLATAWMRLVRSATMEPCSDESPRTVSSERVLDERRPSRIRLALARERPVREHSAFPLCAIGASR